jgi:hypothetical protein
MCPQTATPKCYSDNENVYSSGRVVTRQTSERSWIPSLILGSDMRSLSSPAAHPVSCRIGTVSYSTEANGQ